MLFRRLIEVCLALGSAVKQSTRKWPLFTSSIGECVLSIALILLSFRVSTSYSIASVIGSPNLVSNPALPWRVKHTSTMCLKVKYLVSVFRC